MSVELAIVTPEREAYAGRVQTVVLPGGEGDFGVLQAHERFLCPTRIGEVEIREGARTLYAALAEGFAQVVDDRVVVLVETCELAEEIDTARAERARERAERRLQDVRAGIEEDRALHQAEAALQRAIVRLQVAAKRGR